LCRGTKALRFPFHTLFSIICMFQVASGGPNLFSELAALAALLCLILAVRDHERPISRSLNYWDEAFVFGLISQLG
jgi:hypothetical protein